MIWGAVTITTCLIVTLIVFCLALQYMLRQTLLYVQRAWHKDLPVREPPPKIRRATTNMPTPEMRRERWRQARNKAAAQAERRRDRELEERIGVDMKAYRETGKLMEFGRNTDAKPRQEDDRSGERREATGAETSPGER